MADMIEQSVAQIAEDAINMFLEYRDQHGYDEDAAKAKAIAEIVEGMNVKMDELMADLSKNLSEPTDDAR